MIDVSLADASPALPGMLPGHGHYYMGARDDILATIRSATTDNGAAAGVAADALPTWMFSYFSRIGRDLASGESIKFDPVPEGRRATLTAETRKRLMSRSSLTTSVTERTRLLGFVPQADQDRKTFQLQLSSGKKLSGPMPEPYRETILKAFRGYRDQVKVRMEIVEKLNLRKEVNGWQAIRHMEILDPLDVAVQLDELRALADGWLDGEGLALPAEGLDRLAARFADYYPKRLPLPRIYPTLSGGAQLEWTLGSNEVNVEVNLATGVSEWHVVDVSSGEDQLDSLDLNTRRGWLLLVERIGRLSDSVV